MFVLYVCLIKKSKMIFTYGILVNAPISILAVLSGASGLTDHNMWIYLILGGVNLNMNGKLNANLT